MPFFSKVFKQRDTPGAAGKSKKHVVPTESQATLPVNPKFISSWTSKEIDLEEVEELINACTLEMKSRAEALDAPFLLLPFRPETDVGAARTFIQNFYTACHEGSNHYRGISLRKELALTEPAILCSILKWCWSRIPGGVVSWPTYEGFRLGEEGSLMCRTAFSTFIPLCVDSAARTNIIVDFFDLLAAIAAHSKLNGLGGRKLSRMAAWWAFEHSGLEGGFDDGYKSWASAADASSHLFFAYLRSREPKSLDGFTGINGIPRSLQTLLAQTAYPPGPPSLMQVKTPKVVMLVDSVSPGPFALLRRAKHFEYRDEELQAFSEYDDPVQALTNECKRVLNCIAAANQSNSARSRNAMHSSIQGLGGNKPDESWSRFQDVGFADFSSEPSQKSAPSAKVLRSAPRSRNTNNGRPTTPSWADFLNSGFVDDAEEGPAAATLLLPSDKILPPIGGGSTPGTSDGYNGEDLEPGELASIKHFDLDDTFWWVWIASLASEEPSERKAVFGRCALIETTIFGGRWLVMEEQVKGASPVPEEGGYLVEKKSRFGFTRKGKSSRRRSTAPPKSPEPQQAAVAPPITPNKASMSPKQQTMIRAVAASMVQQAREPGSESAQRRGRHDDAASTKTNSVMTLGLTSEAGPAMKWARQFDRDEIRRQYLGDGFAGKGVESDTTSINMEKETTPRSSSPTRLPREIADRELPPVPDQPEPAVSMSNVDLPTQPWTIPVSVAPHASIESASNQEVTQEAYPFPKMSSELQAPVAEPVEQLPMEFVTSPSSKIERKPVPRTAPRMNNISEHPAFKNKGGELVAAERAANQTGITQDRAPSSDLKKGGQGGFRKMFGMRKDKSFTSAQSAATLQPPSESSLGRKLSLLRRKTSERSPTSLSMHSVEHSVEATTPKGYRHQSSVDDTNFGRVDTQDRADAEHAFSRFDQGPLTDAPAFTPRESTDTADMPASLHGPVDIDHLGAPGAFPETPMDYATPAETMIENDGASEASVPAIDRWAQIRKNAAERAARMSEDQHSRPTQSVLTERTEDDGETSGEETIEARVARIKARVAELTGNMDPPNSRVRY